VLLLLWSFVFRSQLTTPLAVNVLAGLLIAYQVVPAFLEGYLFNRTLNEPSEYDAALSIKLTFRQHTIGATKLFA
jgi:hypothetical protein